MNVSASCPGRFTTGEEAPGNQLLEDSAGITAGLNAVAKRKKIPAPAGNRIGVLNIFRRSNLWYKVQFCVHATSPIQALVPNRPSIQWILGAGFSLGVKLS